MKFESLKGVRLQGIAKSIHKFFLIVTYPFRHSFKFLGFLIVGLVFFASIPMIRGVSFEHILDWYMLKYEEVKDKGSDILKNKPEPVERKIKNAYKKELKLRKVQPKSKQPLSVATNALNDVSADKPQENVKRKTFKLNASPFRYAKVKNTWTKNKKNTVDNLNIDTEIKNQKIDNTLSVETQYNNPLKVQETNVVEMPKVRDELVYRKLDSLELVYEENPEHIEGKAIVFSANDLSVGDIYIILYGIYTDSKKHNGQAAFEYLKELADKKNVECQIVAYTLEHYASAICFIDGRSINKNLVDAGFADNIAL